MCTISVVMPVYNTREEYLREAIESILDQTFTDFEFIIVDDGSDEKTKRILYSYDDDRVIVVTNNENIGITKSLNKGISIANGKYIARMDSDDISLRDRFEKQVTYLETHQDINILGTYVYDGEQIRHEFSNISQKERRTLFILENVGPIHPSVMIRKAFLDLYDLKYNEEYPVAQDYELWVRCNELTDIHFYSKALLTRRKHAEQIGNKRNTLQHLMAARIKTRQLSPLLDDAYSDRQLERILLSVTDGGATYTELCNLLGIIKRRLSHNEKYDKRTVTYIVSAYKIRYLRNNYPYIKRRMFQLGLILSGEFFIKLLYLRRNERVVKESK